MYPLRLFIPIVPLLTLGMLLQQCGKSNDGCIDKSKISNDGCIESYEPVCGCDGKTYNNSCYASVAGVLTWTEGECEQ